ncbi:MAG TPA: hypothetical protein VK838_05360, partial [Candidatus Limnocylindrales bacterium]|nr:hypothetical protein [Candidatus Limnocylindrales bacterium]
MFIPRTLAESEHGRGRGPWVRALIVGALLAVGLWAITSLSIAAGQADFEVGDVAQADIRAPRTISFVSESQTDEKRQEAAAAVQPVYVPIEPRADMRDAKVRDYDAVVRVITNVLSRRDAGTLPQADVPAELQRVAPQLTVTQAAQLAAMSQTVWQDVADAGRQVLQEAMSGPIREDRLSDIRAEVRSNITNELAPEQRELAGDLAAAEVVPNEEYSALQTEASRSAARDAVDPVVVSIRQGQNVIRSGEPITILDLEKLEQLGLTRPRMETSTLAGNGVMSALVAVLLVAFLWRFEPRIWFRNRQLLLFVLSLLLTALAMRIAADRTLWAYVVPSAATVLLAAILLEGSAGAAMAVTLAVLAGIMN